MAISYIRTSTYGVHICFQTIVLEVHNSHLWARANPHAIRERGHQVSSVWQGITTTLGTCYVQK